MHKLYEKLFDLMLFAATPALLAFMPSMMSAGNRPPGHSSLWFFSQPGLGLTVGLCIMYGEVLRLRRRIDSIEGGKTGVRG